MTRQKMERGNSKVCVEIHSEYIVHTKIRKWKDKNTRDDDRRRSNRGRPITQGYPHASLWAALD